MMMAEQNGKPITLMFQNLGEKHQTEHTRPRNVIINERIITQPQCKELSVAERTEGNIKTQKMYNCQ